MTNQTSNYKDELWDIYDRDRNLTGKTHLRSNPLSDGEYNLIVHVCIFNKSGQLLIQKRQPWKMLWPNMWDLSAGGAAISGDDSRSAAEREKKEELGIEIDLSKDRPKFSIYFDKSFDDYWIIEREIEIQSLVLQNEEVADVKWVDKDQYINLVKNHEAVSYPYFDWMFDLHLAL